MRRRSWLPWLLLALCLLVMLVLLRAGRLPPPPQQQQPPTTKGNSRDNETPQPAANLCQPIDIAMVVVGTNASRSAVTLLKSILHYRTTPLRLHVLADGPGQRVMSRLLASWQLQAVSIRFYDAQQLTTGVSWVPTVHAAGVFSLVKLVYEQAFTDVDVVLALDVDLVLTADPAILFRQHLAAFDEKQLIAASPQQSGWYLYEMVDERGPGIIWPARGRGINSGVMLLWLSRMRQVGWANIWAPLTRTQLRTTSRTGLADQDVFNLVHVHRPELVYLLPCAWNVQLHAKSQAPECYKQQKPMVLHWNSPQKLSASFEDAERFRRDYWLEYQLDGDGLRALPFPCAAAVNLNDWPTVGATSSAALASYYSLPSLRSTCAKELEKRKQQDQLRVHVDYYEYLADAGLYDCVVVSDSSQTEGTSNNNGMRLKVKSQSAALAQQRFLRFLRQSKVIPPSLKNIDLDSAAAGVRCTPSTVLSVGAGAADAAADEADLPTDVTLLLHLDMSRLHALPEILQVWDGPVSVALLLTDGELQRLHHLYHSGLLHGSASHVRLHAVFDSASITRGAYPVNLLRNVAWEAVTTSHVLMLDADLLPGPGLAASIRAFLRGQSLQRTGNLEALVVPAFETTEYNFRPPSSKENLRALYESKQLKVFRQAEWPQGHGATNYAQWWTATEPYEISWTEGYEPYIVLPSSAPRYDERLTGFGWNKVLHIELLWHQYQTKFKVLPNGYAVHRPHGASLDLVAFRQHKTATCVKEIALAIQKQIRSGMMPVWPPAVQQNGGAGFESSRSRGAPRLNDRQLVEKFQAAEAAMLALSQAQAERANSAAIRRAVRHREG